MTAAGQAVSQTGQGFGSFGYRTYVLVTLFMVYTLNFIDRVLISVVAQPIIDEFKLADWQFGLLSGFGFAMMYTLMGIPIARLAERYNRVRIIAFCVILWSVMTAACGWAWGFASLLIFRVGVGIGEAGCTPPANSLIGDYYPPKSRTTALGFYAMGVTFGGVLANLFGGPIAQSLSWREAFIYLGLPGVIVGLIVLLTVKEPPRGYSDPPDTVRPEKASMGETLKELGSKSTFWVMSIGAMVAAFVGYGISSFQAAFFIRVHGLEVAEVALRFSVPIGIAGTIGAFAGGWLTEKTSSRFPNSQAWIPAWGFILSVPCYLIGFYTDNLTLALITLMMGGALHYAYLGAQYSIGQGVVSAQSRATAIAILLFIVNIVGYGCGPLFVGIASDFFTSSYIAGSEYAGELTSAVCKGKPAELVAALGQQNADFCVQANGEGLRNSFYITVCFYMIAGIAFLASCRTLQRDLVAKTS